MDEFVLVELRSRPGEPPEAFASRLANYWTYMLRNHEAVFELVFAEASVFDNSGDCVTRQYLAKEEALELLVEQMKSHGVDFAPIDVDETYTKYEAVAPDWMQIEH